MRNFYLKWGESHETRNEGGSGCFKMGRREIFKIFITYLVEGY